MFLITMWCPANSHHRFSLTDWIDDLGLFQEVYRVEQFLVVGRKAGSECIANIYESTDCLT